MDDETRERQFLDACDAQWAALHAEEDAMWRALERTTIVASTVRALSRVSTMTLLAKTNATLRFGALDDLLVALAVCDSKFDLLDPAKAKPSQPFDNQLTFKHGTKSIKMFTNGTVHATGCKSTREFEEVAHELADFLQAAMDVSPTFGTVIRLYEPTLCMLNLNADLGREIKIRRLHDALLERGAVASYDPNTYPGLKILLGYATILLFKSGKIIISGKTDDGRSTPEGVARAAAYVCDVFGALPDIFS